jgi:hypothetical protein
MAAISPLSPRSLLLTFIVLLALSACAGPQVTAADIEVHVQVDGERISVVVPHGSTAQQALSLAGITLGELDQIQPAAYAIVAADTLIQVTRVSERFEIETAVLPFERQTIRNESLPEGETRLLQPGQNGTQETTYRIVLEEGVEISRTPVKTSVIVEPQPEIMMIGAQSAFTPVPIDGTLAYVSAGNAWITRNSSGSRRPLVVTGDLDGQIFNLSHDGDWLLFTRRESDDEEIINTLWMISTTDPEAEPIDLSVQNVIHFADWSPSATMYTIAYTTVESSLAAPGWQANNDLGLIRFSDPDDEIYRGILIPTNSGGQYGWWGTMFAWAPDGSMLAYASPDDLGIVPMQDPSFESRMQFNPYQTLGDWAWVPSIAWGNNGETLFIVEHGAPIGLENPMASPVFDLAALSLDRDSVLKLVPRTGMFANPSVSPSIAQGGGERGYLVAYLQSLSPLESDDSRYRLMVVDRDGSNSRELFPPEGDAGLEAQYVSWSPDGERLVLIYRHDLWIIDALSGTSQQITGDGQALAFDWKP